MPSPTVTASPASPACPGAHGHGAPGSAAPLLPSLATAVADLTERHSPRTAAQCVRALPTSLPVDTILCSAADELRARGRDGLASILLSTRFAADGAVVR